MREIYADFNNTAADGSLPLNCVGSVVSIAALDTPLVEGEAVVLTDGEVRAIGRVARHADGTWDAVPGWVLLPSEPT